MGTLLSFVFIILHDHRKFRPNVLDRLIRYVIGVVTGTVMVTLAVNYAVLQSIR